MTTLTERFVADIDALSDLPSVSPALAQLIATLGREDASVAEIAGIIRQDPVVAARVLRAANSAAYAARTPVSSIRDALLRLGLLRVRRLAVVVSLYSAVPVRGARMSQEAFWRHSLGVAHAAEILGRHATVHVPSADPESLFLSGLLHDIGLLVLASHYPREHAAVTTHAETAGVDFSEAEVAVLQTDHGELGALLASHWDLPAQIAGMIRGHHRLDEAPVEHRWGARVVQLAEFICVTEEIGDLSEGVPPGFDDQAMAELGLTSEDLPMIVTETRAEAARAGSMVAAARD